MENQVKDKSMDNIIKFGGFSIFSVSASAKLSNVGGDFDHIVAHSKAYIDDEDDGNVR